MLRSNRLVTLSIPGKSIFVGTNSGGLIKITGISPSYYPIIDIYGLCTANDTINGVGTYMFTKESGEFFIYKDINFSTFSTQSIGTYGMAISYTLDKF